MNRRIPNLSRVFQAGAYGRPNVSPWTPSKLSSLRYFLDPNSLSYTDAGTTLATNDGDVIYRQVASNNASLYVEQSTLANRPVLKIGANGKRTLLGDGTNDLLIAPSNITVNTGSVTLFALVSCAWQTDKYRPIFSIGYNNLSGIGMVTSGGAAQDWLAKSIFAVGDGYISGRAPRNLSPYGSLTSNTYHTVIAVFSASRAEVYIDGSALTPTVATAGAVPSITAPVSIVGSAVTSDYSNGNLGPSGFCDAAISVGEVALLHTWLAAQAPT